MYLTHALASAARLNTDSVLRLVCAHFRRASRFVLLTASTVLAACARTPSPPPPLPQRPTPQAPPQAPSTTLIRRLQPERAAFLLTSTIVTIELTAHPAIHDSVMLREIVVADLLPDPSNQSLTLEFRSDSGYTLPTDRPPPPETISRTPTPAHVAARVSWTAQSILLNRSSLSSSCSTIPTLLSDLIPILLTRYILLQQTSAQYPDSVRYINCTGGVSITNTLLLRQTPPDSLTIPFQAISSSDSSRALPMHMQGTMMGKATVVPGSGTTALPSTVIVTSTLSVTAKNSKRQQQFRQTVLLELTKQ